jgi:hypothetical protein
VYRAADGIIVVNQESYLCGFGNQNIWETALEAVQIMYPITPLNKFEDETLKKFATVSV